MAEVKKIHGYNIKDETARTNIETLNNNMNTMNTNIQNMNTEINSVKADVILNTANIESMNTEINEINAEVEDVKNSLIVKNRKFIFLGDSYGNKPTAETSWIPLTAKLLGVTDYYADKQGGASFTGKNDTMKFKDLLARLNGSIEYKDAITDIVVCGGFNDRSTKPATIKTAISEFITYAKELYPNANISIGMIGWSNMSEYTTVLGPVLNGYANCVQYGAKYLNGVQYIMHNRKFFHDGVHPNAEGSQYLANGIAQAILTGACTVSYENAECTIICDDTPYIAHTYGSCMQSVNNGVATMFINGGWAASDGFDFKLDGQTEYKIFKIQDGILTGQDLYHIEDDTILWNPRFGCTAPVLMRDKTNNVYVELLGYFYLKDGDVYGSFQWTKNSENVITADQIRTGGLYMTGDTMHV